MGRKIKLYLEIILINLQNLSEIELVLNQGGILG